MGSSGDDGDANLIYALYAIVPVSTLLLFWFVASGFNVQTKRARRQRLATEIARNGSNADSGAALRVHRDETSARGRAPPAAPRGVGREPSYRTRLDLDLELAEERSREGSGSERRGSDGSDVGVMMEGNDKRAASVGSLSESKSDVDSAFEASVRSIHSVDPRRATMLSYVNEELGEMSGRYERLFEAARGAEATRRRDSREEA